MADSTTTNLTALTTLADDDLLFAVDTSATEAKKITVANARTVMQSGAVTSADVTVINVLTQAAYDALGTPAADTLYVVVG